MGVFDFGPDADSIKAALADLDIEDLEVEVDGGTVTISGTAGSQAAADKAVSIVTSTDGVESVSNDLEVAEDEEEDDDSTGGGGGKVHVVVAGDTLWGISEKYYGDGSRYMEIFNANKEVWKNYKYDPNVIYQGWELTIP